MTDKLDLAVIALKIIDKSMSKPSFRKNFSKKKKNLILKNQNDKCNACKKNSKNLEFDHIDGNNSNNILDNCQALCPNCHAKKTRRTNQKNTRLLQMLSTVLRKIKKEKN